MRVILVLSATGIGGGTHSVIDLPGWSAGGGTWSAAYSYCHFGCGSVSGSKIRENASVACACRTDRNGTKVHSVRKSEIVRRSTSMFRV